MTDSDPRDYRSLGDLLRDAREERKLGLEEVNEATRISVRVLQALEQDDLDAASGVIYARGFVRTLAEYYDLDPEWLSAKLDQLAGETSRPVAPVDTDDDVIAAPIADPVKDEPAEPTAPKWEVESTRVRRVGAAPPRRVPRGALIAVLAAVLVVALALVWWLGRGDATPERGARAPAEPTRDLTVGTDGTGAAATDSLELTDAGAEPAFVVEDPEDARPAMGSVLDEDARSVSRRPPERETVAATRATQGDVREESGPAEETAGNAVAAPTQDRPSGPASTGAGGSPDPEPAVAVKESGTGTAEEDEETEPAAKTGLPSVLRPASGGDRPAMELVLEALAPVEITVSADGGNRDTRLLSEGEAWRLEGRDHFSLAVSDPSSIEVRIDGALRSLPEHWDGDEWLLYPRGRD